MDYDLKVLLYFVVPLNIFDMYDLYLLKTQLVLASYLSWKPQIWILNMRDVKFHYYCNQLSVLEIWLAILA